MTSKKSESGKNKSATSMAMGNALNQQKKTSDAIEQMMDKNISSEISGGTARKSKDKSLGEIATEAAVKRSSRAKRPSRSAKAKVITKKVAKKAPAKVAPQKVRKASATKRTKVEVITLGAGIAKGIVDGVSGVLSAGKSATATIGSVVSTTTASVGAGMKDAKTKIESAVKSVKSGSGGKSGSKEAGSVASALKTATSVTEKAAGSVMKVGSATGKACGYVVTGAMAAPVDIVKGCAGVILSTADGVAGLFGNITKKSSKASAGGGEKRANK